MRKEREKYRHEHRPLPRVGDASTSSSSNGRGTLFEALSIRRSFGFGRLMRVGVAGVGIVAIYELYRDYREWKATKNGDTKKKKVLVIPFDRLQIVEQYGDLWSKIRSSINSSDDKRDGTSEITVEDMVAMIHQAASDPSVVALYGKFGHGGNGVASAGWGDLDEIRDALRIFRECHRRHHSPNIQHEIQVIPRVPSKPMYAYSDSFHSLMDPANREYYMASIFTDIHMQQMGELNLFGMMAQDMFIRPFLEKYGIAVHVMKQGEYKNFPNMFTHASYNRPHRQNVTNLLESINYDVCNDITKARSKALLTTWLSSSNKKSLSMPSINQKIKNQNDLWKRIYESGTFPALTAWKAGLIDFIPHRDPLPDLISNNSDTKTKKIAADTSSNDNDSINTSESSTTSSWKLQETDFAKFKANETVSMEKYLKVIKRRERWEKLEQTLQGMRKRLTDRQRPVIATEQEKIALLQVSGAIGQKMARELVTSIRKIRLDTNVKCVVLRVSSPGGETLACETISQELKALQLPIVVSFGNVAASGGYYISANADRIFASSKTVTGSIGVFGMRLDLTGLAKKYGINFQSITSGDLSASFNVFHPMTRKMKSNLSDSIDRQYDHFKALVADGRNLPMEYVQTIARGRVWTGDQGKTNGLVDEIGGLHRAIAYAQRTHTASGTARVTKFQNEKTSLLGRILVGLEEGNATMVWSSAYEWATDMLSRNSQPNNSTAASPDMIAGGLLDCILRQSMSSATGSMPSSIGGILLVADENTALRLLLENHLEDDNKYHVPVLPSYFWD